MKLTQEALTEIVAKSSTFDERLANGYFVTHPDPDQGELGRRLDRWREVAAKGDRQQFHRLLELRTLDVDSIKRGLAPVRLSPRVGLPDWTELLQGCVNATAHRQPESLRFLDSDEPWPFEQIVAPFVAVASEKLRAKGLAGYDHLAEKAQLSLERNLLYWLANVCGSALMLEFSIFRLRRQPPLGQRFSQHQADNSSEIYRGYVGHMLNGGLVPFLQEYSVLARAITILIRNWVDSSAEFLTRLASDWNSLSQTFQIGQDLGKVEELGTGLSDPHRGGRTVFALTFTSKLKLVYKPKSLETEEAYSHLMDWINLREPSLHLKGLHVLSRPGYGWVEFVEHSAPANDTERTRFYHRSGMLLCLFYVLGSTDIHAENLIAAGEHPVLVDAETLITPSLDQNENGEANAWAETRAVRQMKASVLHVGMLPWWRSSGEGQAHDLSALGGVGGEEVAAAEWQGIDTDNLERRVVTGKLARKRNVPFGADQEANPTFYAEEVAAGFREMYKLLLEHRGALLENNTPLDELARSPMRLVFRDTSTYFSILKNSVDASLLRDGAERSIHLELLSRVLLVSDSNARFVPFLKAEKQALTNLDIPFFTIRPQSRAMDIDHGEIIENCFTQAGYESVRERLSGLGDQNLEEQIGIIRGSFWAKAATQRAETPKLEIGLSAAVEVPEPSVGDLLEETVHIAQLLQRQAIRGDDNSFTWLSIISQPNTQTYQFGPLGPALFDGLAGIALFMAALESVNPGGGFRQLAIGTLAPIRRALNSCEKLLSRKSKNSLQNPRLGLTGLGSIIYALTRVGQLLGEEAPLEIARAAASLINPDSFDADSSVDVFNGRAGAILGLLSLYEMREDSFLLDTAIRFGHTLSESNASCANGVGFAAGPAGLAYALCRLYTVTSEQCFLNSAQELMPVDCFDEKRDSRDVSWRAGSSGVGLAWLHTLALLDNGRAHSMLQTAVGRCLSASLSGPDQVCSGIAGRLDFLVEASERGYGACLLTAARKQAGWCIHRAKRNSGFYPHPHLPAGAFLPGFYEGLAGIGYEFLRVAFPGKLPSVLLWS
jgi:type 2 lantibiotic biosynthesis protein LanM